MKKETKLVCLSIRAQARSVRVLTGFVLGGLLPSLSLHAADAAPASSLAPAVAAIRSGDLASAENLLEPLVAASSADPAVYLQLATVRLRQKRTQDAIDLIDRAIKLEPKNPDFHVQLGSALSQRLGEIDFMDQAFVANRMLKAFQTAVALDPDHRGGWIGLVRYYTNAPSIAGGSREKAEAAAEQLRRTAPPLADGELATIALHFKDHAAALTHAEAALKHDDNNAAAHELKGRALAGLGRNEEARASFERALALNPKRESARQALAALPPPNS